MNKSLDDPIINRAMLSFECNTLKDFALLFGKSPQNINNMKNRGTLLRLIETEAYKRKVDFNYILTGEYTQPKATIQEPASPYGSPDPRAPIDNRQRGPDADHYIVKAMRLTSDVMTSQHPEIKSALMKNLEQFSEAVTKADELEGCKVQLKEQDKKIKAMDEEIKYLKTKVDELLKREPHCGSATPGDNVPVLDEKAM